MPPFVVFSLPRSRSAWLARFLTWGDWMCGHDELRHCRSLDDVRAWLAMPCAGSVETVAAPFWRLLAMLAPGARVMTVRRPVADVMASLLRFGLFDETALGATIRRVDAKLDQIEARLPGVLRVEYAALSDAETCGAVFRHCLGLPMPDEWFQLCSSVNIQVNLRHLMRYCVTHRAPLDKLAAVAKHRTLALMVAGPGGEMDGLTFQCEPWDRFYADAQPLFREHLAQTGQAPEDHARKNLGLFKALDDVGALHVFTGRSNGRMFSYLVSIVAPSLDSPDETLAEQTLFFADPSFPGLGMKMQRASVADLKARGVDRVLLRAGHRGSGPRLGSLYRRLGAEPFGQLYSLEM